MRTWGRNLFWSIRLSPHYFVLENRNVFSQPSVAMDEDTESELDPVPILTRPRAPADRRQPGSAIQYLA